MNEHDHYTDIELVNLLRAGDENAFNLLYLRYREELSAYAVRITQSTEDAKDIVQELFANLWLRRTEYDIQGNVKAYLMTSIRYGAIRAIKNSKRRQEYILDFTKFVSHPEYSIEAKELSHQIELAVDKLPKKMAEVYRLSREEELSHQQIAEHLHISEHTAKKQVANALRIIRKEISSATLVLLIFIEKLFQ